MQSPYAPPRAALEPTPEYAHGNWKSPRGRIGRLRYLMCSISLLLLFAPLLALRELFNFATQWEYASIPAALLGLLYVAGALVINSKRIHDVGWSAWWLLLFLVPGANSLLPLVLLLMPGTPGPNPHGLPPPPNSLLVKLAALVAGLALLAFLIFALGSWWLLRQWVQL